MQWLKSRWATLHEAVGFRRFLFGSTITAILGGLHFAESHGVTWLGGIPTWTVVALIVLAMLTWWLLQYANHLRVQAQPRLRVTFAGVTSTDDGVRQLRYVRVKVENISSMPVKNCRGHLVNVKIGGSADTAPKFSETLKLSWATHDPLDSAEIVTVAPLVPQYLDVALSSEKTNRLTAGTLRSYWPHSARGVLDHPNTYVFFVVVSADDCSSVPINIAVCWTAKWEELKAQVYEA
jgi:hypothetical protein